MTITVVTTRDYNGVPSTREVLQGADSYTVVSGDLEIISSAREALAFYASGNWLSVYVDDCVKVNPERSEPGLGGGSATPQDGDVALVVAASGSQAAMATEPARQDTEPTPAEDVAEDAEIFVRPEPVPHRPPRVAAFGSTPETTRSSGMRPVVFRAKAYKPKQPEPEPSPQHRWMRPVIFRAKAYKPKQPEPEPSPHHRWMRAVTIRPKTYAPERDDSPAPKRDQ